MIYIMDTPEHEIDWATGQELVGASAMQVKFAKAIVEGLNLTASARAAGYRGEGAALRGHACRVAKSNKVKALISWARAGGAGPSDVPGDLKELKRILWKHARGADKNHSIKATEVLHRLAAQERELGMTRADDGFEQERLCRDLMMTNEDGAASFMLLLAGQRLALSCLPLLHDMTSKVQATWPEIWAKLLARQSDVMRQDLANKLADRNYQRGTRELIWGEKGWVLGSDNRPKPDPEGRAYVAPVTPLPGGIVIRSGNGADTAERPRTDGKEAKEQTAAR
jgi:hypothetical protein